MVVVQGVELPQHALLRVREDEVAHRVPLRLCRRLGLRALRGGVGGVVLRLGAAVAIRTAARAALDALWSQAAALLAVAAPLLVARPRLAPTRSGPLLVSLLGALLAGEAF